LSVLLAKTETSYTKFHLDQQLEYTPQDSIIGLIEEFKGRIFFYLSWLSHFKFPQFSNDSVAIFPTFHIRRFYPCPTHHDANFHARHWVIGHPSWVPFGWIPADHLWG
jgi:hypothetical protein